MSPERADYHRSVLKQPIATLMKRTDDLGRFGGTRTGGDNCPRAIQLLDFTHLGCAAHGRHSGERRVPCLRVVLFHLQLQGRIRNQRSNKQNDAASTFVSFPKLPCDEAQTQDLSTTTAPARCACPRYLRSPSLRYSLVQLGHTELHVVSLPHPSRPDDTGIKLHSKLLHDLDPVDTWSRTS